MNILLLETSSSNVEFAYNKKGDFVILKALGEGKNADDLVPELKSAFEAKGLKFGEIDVIGLSNGPGSFTGLRIGSAVAKGICFSGSTELIELCTLDIIANKYKDKADGKIVVPLIFTFSKSREFYFAEYRNTSNGLERVSGYGTLTPEEIKHDGTRVYVINEKPGYEFGGAVDLTGTTNMESMLELTVLAAGSGKFGDKYKSEPFYMKNLFGHV